MIQLLLKEGPRALELEDYCITHVSGGLDTLEFDIAPAHALYGYLEEETGLTDGDNRYLIKAVNERSRTSTISCNLDLDFLQERAYRTYRSEGQSLYDLLSAHLPEGWTIEGADLITDRPVIELEGVTDYDILMHAMESYGVVYEWHICRQKLAVLRPELVQPSGTYLTEELNLQSMSFKGQSSNLVTRLYPYGKDGLTIAAINGGKPYVENHTYSDKVVSQVWTDQKYTDAVSLRDEAIERLKKLAVPVRSYECSVMDLAKVRPEYEMLEFKLYDVVLLLDPQRKTRVEHRIAEYKEYPLHPEKNVVTLSTAAAKVTTQITQMRNELREEMKVDRQIVRTVEKNAQALGQRIEETYTKGETDSKISSALQQTQEAIVTEVSKAYATKKDLASALTASTVQYALSSSADAAPSAGWVESMPQRQEGEYIWQRTVSTYGDETQKASDPVCLSIAAAGKDGRGIVSVKSLYAVSVSDSEAPAEWTETAPVMSANSPYLWSYELITYSDETTSASEPRVIGIYGKGEDGVVYTLSVSPQLLNRTYEGELHPQSIIVNSLYRSGSDVVSHLYAGRYVIEESADGETYQTVYTSSADESGLSYQVVGSNTRLIKVSLYAAGESATGARKLLAQQSAVIVQDGTPSTLLTIRSTGGTVFHNGKGQIQLVAEGRVGSTVITDAAYQWYKEGEALEGETGAAYIAAASTIGSHPAVYRCDMTYEGKAYTASITLENKIEFTVSEAAPEDPAVNEVWLDKSEGSRILKYWNGTDWVAISDYKGELEQVRDEQSQLLQEASGIVLQHLESYSEKSELAELRESLLTQLSVLEGKIEMKFETAQESVMQIGDALEVFKNLTQTFIQFGAEGMSIGKSDSPFKSVFTNDRLSFQQDGAEVAYISNNKLYITDAEIKGSLYLTNGDQRSRWYVDDKGSVCLQ